MASLLFKLFQTMPLAAVVDGLLPDARLGEIAGWVQCHLDPVDFAVDPPVPSDAQISATSEGRSLPIWGYSMDTAGAGVSKVTCRVRGDEFKQYVVLDRVDFGCTPRDDPKGFARSVRVRRHGREFELPLTEQFRLMTFGTVGAVQDSHTAAFFPLEARHDPAFVLVYAYDILPITGELMSLRDDRHPEKAAIDGLLTTCLMLNQVTADDERDARAYLYSDDLWHPSPTTGGDELAELLAASAGLPGLGAIVGGAVETVGITPTRVLVALCFTPCKERDDYVPGHILGANVVGMGRLYPHIMVIGTEPLEEVHTAIRLARPKQTTIVGGHVCGCGEMLTEIGSGLWTDANEGNEMGEFFSAMPLPFWNNIFNYYVIDPDLHPATADKRIPMVRRGAAYRDKVDATIVARDASSTDGALTDAYPENAGRIQKAARQGAFDNIHLAPRMRVTAKLAKATSCGSMVEFTTPEEWKMDKIAMAPFCAHDCFHMHFRWSAGGGPEQPILGWNAISPYVEPEAPMVPMNHDIDVLLLNKHSYMVIDTAFDAPADVWQIHMYPGCGYALTTRFAADLAPGVAMVADGFNLRLFDERGTLVGGWALLYWRLRYYVVLDGKGSFEVRERVVTHDLQRAMEF